MEARCNRTLDLLAALTAVFPYIPMALDASFFAQLPDFGAGDAFIVSVIPLPDVLGDLDPGIALHAGAVRLGAVGVPWQRSLDAEVQQLKGLLGSLSGRNIAVLEVSALVYNRNSALTGKAKRDRIVAGVDIDRSTSTKLVRTQCISSERGKGTRGSSRNSICPSIKQCRSRRSPELLAQKSTQ